MQLFRPDFTNFCDNDTTFAILLLTTICETTHKQCNGEQCSPDGSWELKPRNSPKRAVEGASPYIFVPTVLPPQNRCRSLRVYIALWDRNKAVQSFCSDTALFCSLLLYAFSIISAPLSRLSPNEALPQAPTGLCPVPTRGFTP